MLKVRGYRIERGEVEAALLAHPRVREAAVIVAGGGMDAALWAFLVPSDGEAVSLIELKRHCAERLPRYMIVDRAKTLAELPRNAKRQGRSLQVESPGGGLTDEALCDVGNGPLVSLCQPATGKDATIHLSLCRQRCVGIP
ncbi:hypothetical protein P4110_01840 [Pseudomonas aeruginosa]|nr:hypothetical protein [Pseudomonas aeruginosa]